MDVKTCYCPHQACSKYGIQGQGSHIVHKGFDNGPRAFRLRRHYLPDPPLPFMLTYVKISAVCLDSRGMG